MVRYIALGALWLGSLAVGIAVYAQWFAPKGSSGEIATLRQEINDTRAQAANIRSRLTLDEATAEAVSSRVTSFQKTFNSNVKVYNNTIDCIRKFLGNTSIQWGGGLPSGSYFLVVDNKDKYVNGGC